MLDVGPHKSVLEVLFMTGGGVLISAWLGMSNWQEAVNQGAAECRATGAGADTDTTRHVTIHDEKRDGLSCIA